MTSIPGRLVISNNGTSTENVSSYLDNHLKSLVLNAPHILEDTRDFVNYIEDLSDLPGSSILVSLDVVSLCSYIPHEEDIETMVEYLKTGEDKPVPIRVYMI